MEDKGILAIVTLVLDAIDDGKAALADGHVTILDIPKFANLLPDLLALFGSLALVPSEIKNLTLAEDQAIVLQVMQRLGLNSTQSVAVAQAALKLAADLYGDTVSLLTAIKGTPSQAV